VAGREECGFCKRGKKTDPDLSGFSQPAGLRVRSIPTVLFQVFGPVGRVRRTSGGLDHRISVVVVVVVGDGVIVTSGCGDCRSGGITTSGAGISAGTTAAVGNDGSSAYAVVGDGGGSGDGSGGAFDIGGGDDFSIGGGGDFVIRGGGAFGVGGDGTFDVGGSGAFGAGDTTTVVVVDVGYDYGVSGAIRAVAVGPPEHSQHNIRSMRCRDYTAAETRKWSAAVYGHPTRVNETSTKNRLTD